MLTLELGTMVVCAAVAVWIAYTKCTVEEPAGPFDDAGEWQAS